MLKQHKDILAAVIRDLRRDLLGTTEKDGAEVRGDLDRELERLGVLRDGRVQPIDALPGATPTDVRAHEAAERFIEAVRRQGRPAAQARAEFVEQAAYSWLNRLVALRALEARRLITGILRPSEDYGGVSEAIYLLAQTDLARVAAPDGGWWAVIDQACAGQAQALPGLFGPGDPVLALRPSLPALRRCVERIGRGPSSASPEETDAAFADPDAIGWAYQFYQEEAKAAAFASFKAGKKADSRATIAAATQLFTEPYMVKWLLQNSLGRSYHEIYPDSALPASWEYYIRPSEERPLGQPAPTVSSLEMLTVLDPCVGSGHFLREAFDMLAAMYRERYPDWEMRQIVETILRRHLHGIDIDPRAVQLAALTLYMRALELLRDEARARRRPMPRWTPSQLNLATTPSGLDERALERHLVRHPQDQHLRPVLERIFESLSQAELLGSLLRPGDEIDTAIAKLQAPRQTSMFHASTTEDSAVIRRDPAVLKQLVLDQVAKSFRDEAISADPADALFGREAERGVRLLQLLDRKYAIVVTNPPYMGSKNMPTLLKKYIDQNYKAGKRDIYAAFILRCLDFCIVDGRVSMVTQQSWMFQSSYISLRLNTEDQSGLLIDTTITAIACLGRHAFSEADPPSDPVMFNLENHALKRDIPFWAFRIAESMGAEEQASLLRNSIKGRKSSPLVSWANQQDFRKITDSPLSFWVGSQLLGRLSSGPFLGKHTAFVKAGLSSASADRFVAYVWEHQNSDRWFGLAKGGGHKRWDGFTFFVVDWQWSGMRIKHFEGSAVRNEDFQGEPGLTYSLMARGSMSCRTIQPGTLFDFSGAGVFPRPGIQLEHLFGLQSRISSYLLRVITQDIKFAPGYVQLLPLVSAKNINVIRYALLLKRILLSSDLLEVYFSRCLNASQSAVVSILLSCCEARFESDYFKEIDLTNDTIDAVLSETGTPAGLHPLLAGYDALPELPAELDLPELPAEVLEYLERHPRLVVAPDHAGGVNPAASIAGKPAEAGSDAGGAARFSGLPEPSRRLEPPGVGDAPGVGGMGDAPGVGGTITPAELARLKARLRALYEAGPGAKDDGADDEGGEDTGDDEEGESAVAGAHIPIPTETFLEELSVKLELHPISVYWLLEELRAEGARCKPEERRLLEDRLSVLALRLLGHRWPKQIEAGEALPSWADADGIIPLVNLGTGEATLAARLRERLRDEDGETGAQRTEALLAELTGATSLEDWCARLFWPRHVKQFKSRPIAWHVASRPAGDGSKRRASARTRGIRQAPLFECMLYYHATGDDALARLRTQYVEPLLRREESALAEALGKKNTEAAASANARVEELRDLLGRLQQVEREGFACADLDALLAQEPLDRWSGDGIAAPDSGDDLARQERAWRVDLNDGVRVNIAPLQLAGVLAGEVLKAADAKKAIADRARWRADERRWVREGKLPRCGWMDEGVPESPAWTKRAPERAAEQRKLEEKRRGALSSPTSKPAGQ